MKKLLLLAALSCSALAPTVSGCRLVEEQEPRRAELRASSTAVFALQVVELEDAGAQFQAESYTAKVGDREVVLVRVAPTKLAFIAPMLAAGAYSLTVERLDGTSYPPVALEVVESPAISDPVATVHARLDAIDARIRELRKKHASAPELTTAIDSVAANLARFREVFDASEASVQTEVAAYLAANDPETSPMLRLSDVRKIVARWSRVGLGLAGMRVAYQTAKVPGAGAFSAVLGLASATLFGLSVLDLWESFDEVTKNTVVRVIDSVTGALPSVHYKSDRELTFVDGRAQVVPFNVKMRNVNRDDIGSVDPMLAEVADAFVQFQGVTDTVNEILAFFELQPLPGSPDLAAVEPIVRDLPLAGGSVVVENVSPSVTMTAKVPLSNGARLTFTSADCKKSPIPPPIPFSFDTVYSEVEYPDLRTPYTATLRCPDLCEQRIDRGDACPPKKPTCDGDNLVEYAAPTCEPSTGGCLTPAIASSSDCRSAGATCVADASLGAKCEPIACAASETRCGTKCVDTSSNSAHCGACFNLCATSTACMSSACVDPRAIVVGTWTVTHSTSGVQKLTIETGGTGYYDVSGTRYPITWSVKISADGPRLYERGFWHFAYDSLDRTPMTSTTPTFRTYGSDGSTALTYTKS